MSLTKIIFIVLGVGAVIFIGMIVSLAIPTIKNVSHYTFLKPLLNKPLTLKSESAIYRLDKGSYRFETYTLYPNQKMGFEKKLDLPIGSIITLKEFKTYRSNIGSGFTDLFAIGEYVTSSGEKIKFEYVWSNLDHSEPVILPTAIWQDNTETLINFEK